MRTLIILSLVGIALAGGSLGTEFGDDGIVVTPDNRSIFLGVVVQPDGKIVAVGEHQRVDQTSIFTVYRYNADGSLDDGTASDSTPGDEFGTNGCVTPFGSDSSAPDSSARSVMLVAGNRILVLGQVLIPASGKGRNKIQRHTEIALVRLEESGALDGSFDGGKPLVDVGGLPRQFALQGDKIVVLATATAGTNDALVLVRFHGDGTIDTSFGPDGNGIMLDNPTEGDEDPRVVGIQLDGRIVVGGGYGWTSGSAFLARYTIDGDVDTTFGAPGDDGLVSLGDSMMDGLGSIAIDDNDRILIVGRAPAEEPAPPRRAREPRGRDRRALQRRRNA